MAWPAAIQTKLLTSAETLSLSFVGACCFSTKFTTKDHDKVFGTMDFDWNKPPFNLNSSLNFKEIEESFEDPFAVRLLPDTSRFAAQARYFNLGVSSSGTGIFSVYRTNGKSVRIIFARPFEPEEKFFYQRKMTQAVGSTVP